MKKVVIEGQVCIGPTFTRAEFAQIKSGLSEQKGLGALADLLAVSGNRQRLRIIYLLHAHSQMCVCDLAECLEMKTSAVSQHLRKLRDKNIVRARRVGQTIFYSLVSNVFNTHLVKLLGQDEIKEPYSFMYEEI